MPNRRVIDSVLNNYRKGVYVDYLNKDLEALEKKMKKLEDFIKEYRLQYDKPTIDTLVYIQVLYAELSSKQ